MAYWSPVWVMRMCPLRSRYIFLAEVPKGPGIPNARPQPASNAVRRCGLLIRKSVTPIFIKRIFPQSYFRFGFGKMLPAGAFICESLHYEPVCPLFRAFFAAFSLSGSLMPQAIQQKTSSFFSPTAPHPLHSLLISFPSTSIRAIDCS